MKKLFIFFALILHLSVYAQLSGTDNGHDWVDLGLPSGTKWATCNIGATQPEAIGEYFAWGETKTKPIFRNESCFTYERDLNFLYLRGIINETGELTPEYDAASVNWGNNWRMPTQLEMNELINLCQWRYKKSNNTTGYLVQGPNGKTIFLPSTGVNVGTTNIKYKWIYYWTATAKYETVFHSPLFGSRKVGTDEAICLKGYIHSVYINEYERGKGLAIRPVFDKKK